MSKSTFHRPRAAKGDVIRLLRGEHHVASLLRLTNGRWCICDPTEKRLDKRDYLQPGHARDVFDAAHP